MNPPTIGTELHLGQIEEATARVEQELGEGVAQPLRRMLGRSLSFQAAGHDFCAMSLGRSSPAKLASASEKRRTATASLAVEGHKAQEDLA
jgi:hypothetical protein